MKANFDIRIDNMLSGVGASGTPVPMGTGYRPEKNFWVPMGTEYRTEKKFGYRWVPGTGKIFTYADPWVRRLPGVFIMEVT